MLLPLELQPTEAVARSVAAVTIVLRDGERGLEVLLVRRAKREGDPWSGQVGLPGGRHREEDGTMIRTAFREAREEVGLDLRGHAEMLGRLPLRAPGNEPDTLVVPYVAIANGPLVPVTGPEITSAFWCPLADLPSTRTEAVVATQMGELTVPAFVHERRVIWGFTHRLLEELLTLIGSGTSSKGRSRGTTII